MKNQGISIADTDIGAYKNIFCATCGPSDIPCVDLRPAVGREEAMPLGGQVLPEHLAITIRDGASCLTFDLHWKDVEGIYAEISGPMECERLHHPPVASCLEQPDQARAIYDIFEDGMSTTLAVVDLVPAVVGSCCYLVVRRIEMASHRGSCRFALIGISSGPGGYGARVLGEENSVPLLLRPYPALDAEAVGGVLAKPRMGVRRVLKNAFRSSRAWADGVPTVSAEPVILEGPGPALLVDYVRYAGGLPVARVHSVLSWTDTGTKVEDFGTVKELFAAYPELLEEIKAILTSHRRPVHEKKSARQE
jgi:hypothetical protein